MVISVAFGCVLLALRADRVVPLGAVKPVSMVSSGLDFKQIASTFSIGGVIYKEGFSTEWAPNSTGAASKVYMVYQIPERAKTFRAGFGFLDAPAQAGAGATIKFFIDGEPALAEEVTLGDKPKDIAIDLTGHRALKIELIGGGALGEPGFLVEGAASAATEAAPASEKSKSASAKKTNTLPRVNIVAPASGKVFRDKFAVEWDPIRGAVAYGVEFVLVSKSPEVTTDRFIRSFTTKTTSFEWLFSGSVAPGEYQVSIIAFGNRGVISQFSAPRSFKVVK